MSKIADWSALAPWSGIQNKPDTFPPGGSAGGDLTGSYPNPTIRNPAKATEEDAVTVTVVADKFLRLTLPTGEVFDLAIVTHT